MAGLARYSQPTGEMLTEMMIATINVWLGLGGDEGCLTVDVPMHRLLCRRDPQSTRSGTLNRVIKPKGAKAMTFGCTDLFHLTYHQRVNSIKLYQYRQ